MLKNNPWKECALLLIGITCAFFAYCFANFNYFDDFWVLLWNPLNFYSQKLLLRNFLLVLFSCLFILILCWIIKCICVSLWDAFNYYYGWDIYPRSKAHTTVSVEQHKKEVDDATNNELKKLFESENYQKMRQDKGEDMKKWNWQVKERLEREEAYKSGKELVEMDEEI